MSERLRSDVSFTDILGKLVSGPSEMRMSINDHVQVEGRISAFRNMIKKSCVTHATAEYGLKKGRDTSDKVKDLLEKKAYIYPVERSKVCIAAPDGLCRYHESFVRGSNTNHTEMGSFKPFSPTRSSRGQPRLHRVSRMNFSRPSTNPMTLRYPHLCWRWLPPEYVVLLLFTALLMSISQVHLVIYGWETGTNQRNSFSASFVTAIYNKHMTLLGTLIDRKLGAYHKLMAGLFASALYGSLIHINCHSHVHLTGLTWAMKTMTLTTSLLTSTSTRWRIDWTRRSQ
jgi:hypothetical protein